MSSGDKSIAMAALSAEKGPLFKVILLGEAGVGKTAIFHRAKENSFNDGRKSTVGIDSFSLYVKVGDQQVTVSESKLIFRILLQIQLYYFHH